MVSLLFGFVFVVASLPNVLSECGVCGTTSHVACLSEKSFQYCFGDVPDIRNTVVCPNNTVCTDTAQVCAKQGTPACVSECGKCGTDGRFACMNQNTFALCLGGQTPDPNVNGTCPDGKVCKLNAPKFCIDPAAGKDKSSCAAGEEASTQRPPTTTTPRPTNPADFCRRQEVKVPSRNAVPGDSTCRRYIYCYVLEGLRVGREYSCPPKTTFDPSIEQCVWTPSGTCARF